MSGARDSDAFRGRTVLVMILVGVLAFIGLTVLSVYAPQLSSGDDGGGHSLSRSAVGFAGATKLFQARGDTVMISRGPIRTEGRGLLILTPGPNLKRKAVDDVVFGGVRLIVLPKWDPKPHPFHRGWVARDGLLAPGTLARGLPSEFSPGTTVARRPGRAVRTLWRTGPDGARSRLGVTGPLEDLQVLQGPRLEPVITDDAGGIVLARVHNTRTYLLADPDLLDTQGLKSLATARVAGAMIDMIRPQGPLIFDVTLHGYKRTRSVLALALEPPFLGATLCAFAAALLAGLGAAVRFGPVRRAPPPFALGKAALVDSTAGLIRMAGREPRMAEGYARLCRTLAARAVGAPRQLEPEALEQFLDRLGAGRGVTDRFSDLIQAARETRDLATLMTVTRKLYDWRLEMTREHR